jgi:ABC-type proline/glycine betaine transport system ATPase subunit
MARVIMENVSKQFGTVQAVKDFNLTVEDKEFAILVGPSGCGKSTSTWIDRVERSKKSRCFRRSYRSERQES